MNPPPGPWFQYTRGGRAYTWRSLPMVAEVRKASEAALHGQQHGLRNFQVHAFGPLVVAYDGDGTVADIQAILDLFDAGEGIVDHVLAGVDAVAGLLARGGLLAPADAAVCARAATVNGLATHQLGWSLTGATVSATAFGDHGQVRVVHHLLAYVLGLDGILDREALRG